MSTKATKIPCKCCGVFHDPMICAQCQVGGCGATLDKKNHKCRLQGTLLAAMQMSEFELCQRVAELEMQNAALLADNHRLQRFVGQAAGVASEPGKSLLSAPVSEGGVTERHVV